MSDTERSSSARAICALASSRRPHSNPSPPRSISGSETSSTFNPDNDDALMSTRHNLNDDDSHFLPKLRTTAQQRRFYNPEPPAPHVPTSVVRGAFGDFDHSNSTDDELEVGRGFRNTPSRPNKSFDSEMLLDIGNSVYEVTGTPPSRPKHAPKPNLRKEVSLRRASTARNNGGAKSYAKPSSRDAQHLTTEDHGMNMRSTRFGSGTASADNDTFQKPMTGTPHRALGTPRANTTAQSFLLPDMPNLTELVAGSYKDGTPIFSRTGRAKSRVASLNVPIRPSQPNFTPVGGIPVPEEEKALLAALHILKDKLADMEQEKAQSDRRLEEYEMEVSEMRVLLDAQANIRRSDSALGSTDGEAPANQQSKWKVDKTRMEASMQALTRRVEQADQKALAADTAKNRIIQERDSLVTQLGVAFYNSEELKSESTVLKSENRLLQNQVTDLQRDNQELLIEIEQLRSQYDLSHDRHENETQQWQKKEAVFTRKVNSNHRVVEENQTLRDELARAQEQQAEAQRQVLRKEARARRDAERAAEVEHVKLSEENELLKMELKEAKIAREAEIRRWAGKEAELQAHIDQREETIHGLQAAIPHDQINEALRQENSELKAQLARHKVQDQPDEQGTPKDTLRKRLEETNNQQIKDSERWTRQECRLQDHLDQARQFNQLYQQIDTLRTEVRPSKATTANSKRRSTGEIDEANTQGISGPIRRGSRSRSRSRAEPRAGIQRGFRHASAPVTSDLAKDAENEDDSTGGLSFDPAILAGAPKSGGTSKRPTGFVAAHTGDTTYLSFIEGDEIEKLRRRLEEERLANRQCKNVQSTEADTTGYTLRHRGSQKDMTARSRASSRARSRQSMQINSGSESSDIEEEGRKDATIRTNLSRASRASHHRRQSSVGFTEMTSAFILPDITMHSRNDLTTGLSLKPTSHKAEGCTVCQLILSNANEGGDIASPAIVPITQRPEYQADVDATLRPSQPTSKALSSVLKSLDDELTHLKLELSVLTTQLRSLDPALNKRKTAALHGRIEKLNRAIKVKTECIYSLYDVVEVHKEELHQMSDSDELPEELEKTLENIRVERTKLNAAAAEGKKVVFGAGATVESDDESDLPWGGISDTEGF